MRLWLSSLALVFGFSLRVFAEWGSADHSLLGSIQGDVGLILEDTGLMDDNLRLLQGQFDTQFMPLMRQSIYTNGTILRRLIELQRAIEPMRDYHGNFVLNESGLLQSDNLLYNSWRAMNVQTNLAQFLWGSPSWNYSEVPLFDFVSEGSRPLYPRAPVAQSLAAFLCLALGGFYEDSGNNPSFENGFTWDATFRHPVVKDANVSARRFFTFWQAEALRRIIANQTNGVPGVSKIVDALEDVPADYESADTNAVPVEPGDFEIDRADTPSWWDKNLVGKLDWQLQGSLVDPVLYQGQVTGMTLKMQTYPWGAVLRSICTFLVAVSTAVVMVGIIKSEIDFWSTLGGSAT